MSVAFYMDEHVPFAITAGLTFRGVDVLTVQADGSQGCQDTEILDRKADQARVLRRAFNNYLKSVRA